MKREVKIPKGWRRGGNAVNPQPKLIPKVEPVEIQEVTNNVQPETKIEERETKSRKGKKEKVVEPVLLLDLPEPTLDVLDVLVVEEGVKDGND